MILNNWHYLMKTFNGSSLLYTAVCH